MKNGANYAWLFDLAGARVIRDAFSSVFALTMTAYHQAVESTIFPKDDVACMLVEKDCRKLAKLAAPPLPPKSAINVSKLFCNDASAVLLAVLVAVPVEVLDAVLLEVEPVDDPVMDWIKLLISDVNCLPWPPLQPDEALVADVAACAVSVDSDLRAAMRFFKKSCNAFATSVVDDAALELDVPDVAAVLPEAAAVLEVEAVVTPSDDNAASRAAIKPPAGDEVDCASAVDDTPVEVLDSCANSADILARELVCPELAIELTLICCS